MKKSTLLIAGLLALGSTAMHADEGMWTLYNLPEAVYEQMVAEGFQLPQAMLYGAPNAISNSVINFSGYCSGVVVSPNGLVFTNHHCGFSAINAHSTVEHDYMKNGFYAKTYAEELPNKDLFVSFMKKQEDITARVSKLVAGKNSEQTEAIIDSLTNHLTDSIKAIDKTLHISIDPFYEGNKYYATTYQDFPDVRLVFTVPKSMGKFGGETDNWMWPRQTSDFSVFRIYADPKTNGPAAYSKDNVPYKPANWAPVSLEGYKDKDFAMTIGYPGSTNRYLSSYGIQQRRDINNAVQVQARGIKLAILKRYMDKSEKTRIQYEDKYVGAANYWKNSMGMNKCIDSIGLIRQKAEYEAKIQRWLDEKKVKDPSVDVDFAKLSRLYKESNEPALVQAYWRESFWKVSEFIQRAFDITRGAIEPQGPENDPKGQYILFKDNSNDWNLALDKEMTAAMLKNYAEHVPAQYLPEAYNEIKTKFGNNYKKYVDWLYSKSMLLVKGHKFYNDEKTLEDPGILLGVQLVMVYQKVLADYATKEDAIANEEKKLCEAKVQMEMDMPHYSDANFTMRLSYGQVGGYMLGGFDSNYYTAAESIVEKMKKGKKLEDYKVEPVMMELMSAKDFGRYADKTTGKMQLCFLTNNDITGGNSGSSDINFDRKLARCIGVDIRYVLYLMDKWGHADRLLNEINPQ